LNTYLLAKSIHELRYELNNRPDGVRSGKEREQGRSGTQREPVISMRRRF